MTDLHAVLKEMREATRAMPEWSMARGWTDRLERALAAQGEVVAWYSQGYTLPITHWGVEKPTDGEWLPLFAAPPAAAPGWQEAIEAAARVCDEYPQRDPAQDGNGWWAAEECADAIRALLERRT